jgi:hypothetical protein
MMKTSSGAALKVMSEAMVTPAENDETPGKNVSPPMVPPPIFFLDASVLGREVTSAYAVLMSLTAWTTYPGGSGVIRRKGFARDLRGSRKLSRRVNVKVKPVMAPERWVRLRLDDIGNGHGGRCCLCRWQRFAGRSKIDLQLIIISLMSAD